MSGLNDFIINKTALVSGFFVALTAFLTGPIFRLDPAAVGSATGFLVVVLNLWVYFNVYSKKGAAKAATAAATEAVTTMTDSTVGQGGEITPAGEIAVEKAVEKVLGSAGTVPPPGNTGDIVSL